jgi:hypothetical protein
MTIRTHTSIAALIAALGSAACGHSDLSMLPAAPSTVAGVSSASSTGDASLTYSAFAKGGKPGRPVPKPAKLVGRVEAVDLVARTLLVHGTLANVPLEAVIRHGFRLYTLEDVHAGYMVQIKGTIVEDAFTATEVKVEVAGAEVPDDTPDTGEEPDDEVVVE